MVVPAAVNSKNNLYRSEPWFICSALGTLAEPGIGQHACLVDDQVDCFREFGKLAKAELHLIASN
jgi:hypothetical protein